MMQLINKLFPSFASLKKFLPSPKITVPQKSIIIPQKCCSETRSIKMRTSDSESVVYPQLQIHWKPTGTFKIANYVGESAHMKAYAIHSVAPLA